MSDLSRPYATIDGAYPIEGLTRKATRSPPSDEVCCIYVHAGAGYHSHQNEKIHLEACNEYVDLPAAMMHND
jgi:taspase (threonine aspartase 1)